MTDDDRKPGAGWDAVEDLLAEEEIERQRAMPAEERRAAMKAQGLDPDRAHAVASEVLAKLGLATPAPAPKVVSLAAEREKRRPPRPTWVLALVAAAAAVVVVGGGGAIVALNGPTPSATTPTPTVPTAPPGPSPEELAQEQRAVASVQCAAEKWNACSTSLGDAFKLDPQGDETRRVKRLHGEVERGITRDNLESKEIGGPRSLRPEGRVRLVAALAPSKGQAVRVACERGPEPSHLCAQLVAALTSAGWAVTRATVATDAGIPAGIRVEVATDADETTQAAADVLAVGLGKGFLFAHGPDDAPPGASAPLQLTVGAQ